MSKMIVKMTLFAGCCLVPLSSSVAVELVIPTDVSTTLNRQLERNYSRYQVDMSEAKRIGEGFQECPARAGCDLPAHQDADLVQLLPVAIECE